MTEDEMVGWHHRLNGHESEQILIEVLIFLKKRTCSLIGWWLLSVTNRTGSRSITHREPFHYLATKGPTSHGQFSGDSNFSGFLILA